MNSLEITPDVMLAPDGVRALVSVSPSVVLSHETVAQVLEASAQPLIVGLEEATRSALWRARREWLVIAAIITFASHAVPDWIYELTVRHLPRFWQTMKPGQFCDTRNYWDLLMIAFGATLVLTTPLRSGLTLGRVRGNIGRLLLLFGVPLVGEVMIYPMLPVQPFGRDYLGQWLLSPLAQDLIFAGFLFGKFDVLFPGQVHRRIPAVRWAAIITGIYFAAWHLPNLRMIPAGYVLFQMLYVFTAAILGGMSRYWTGSILWIILAHTAGDFVPWLLG